MSPSSTPPAPTDAEVREAREKLQACVDRCNGTPLAIVYRTILAALDKAQGEVERLTAIDTSVGAFVRIRALRRIEAKENAAQAEQISALLWLLEVVLCRLANSMSYFKTDEAHDEWLATFDAAYDAAVNAAGKDKKP